MLTRLHLRYGKGALGDDLIFRAAPAIVGGREIPGPQGMLEEGARPASVNNFQGRYAIRHAWAGPVACDNPRRGIWGGPPPGTQQIATGPKAATDLAFAPRGRVQLASFVSGDIPGLGRADEEPAPERQQDTPPAAPAPGTDPAAPPDPGATQAPEAATPDPAKSKTSKGCSAGGNAGSAAVWLAVLALCLIRSRRPRLR